MKRANHATKRCNASTNRRILETVRGSVDCTVKVFSLGEYSILYSYNDSSQHASVSHSHKEVGLKVTKIIITQLLKQDLKMYKFSVFLIVVSYIFISIPPMTYLH